MYRSEEIKEGLFGLWGWHQNYNVTEFTIAQSLTATETGQHFQEVHPLLTLNNIKAIAPDFEAVVYSAWNVDTTYQIGAKVTYQDINYKATQVNQGRMPDQNPQYWEQFDEFSEWLEEKTKAYILKAVRSFWDQKMDKRSAKNILEAKPLFNSAGRLADVIENAGYLVGFELVPIRANGVTLRIDKIGTQFTGQGEIKLYVFHSSRKDAVQTITVNQIRDGGMQWTATPDLFLPYVSDDNDAGGSWYLVYDQGALPSGMQAVEKTKDWSAKPCYTCSTQEARAQQIWSKYLEVYPFKIGPIAETLGDFNNDFNNDFSTLALKLWDIQDNTYDMSTNYGLNLQISLECDITDLILQQKIAFQNLIGLQVGVEFLREMAYNPNHKVNRAAQNINLPMVLRALEGDGGAGFNRGLVHDLKQALKAVDIDATDFSRVCFPCEKKGIRFRTA